MFPTPDLNSHTPLSKVASLSLSPGPFLEAAAPRPDAPPFDVSLKKAILGSAASSRARGPVGALAGGKPGRKIPAGVMAEPRPDTPGQACSPSRTVPRKSAPPNYGAYSKARLGAAKAGSAAVDPAQATDSRGRKLAEKSARTDASRGSSAPPSDEPAPEVEENSSAQDLNSEEGGSSEATAPALNILVIPAPSQEPMAQPAGPLGRLPLRPDFPPTPWPQPDRPHPPS